MMPSSSVCLLGLLLAAQPAAELDLDERIDGLGVVLAPRGWHPSLRSSDLLDATDDVVRRVSRLRLRSSDQAGLNTVAFQRCGHTRRFLCWMQTVARATSMPRVRYPTTIVMIVHPRAGKPAMTIVVLDSKPFFVLRDTASPDAVESALRQSAMTVGPFVMTGETWRKKLHENFGSRIGRYLARRGQALDHGSVALTSPCTACEVRIDGRAIGVIGTSSLRLKGLRSGVRSISLFHSGEPFESGRVRVRPGNTVDLALKRRIEPPDPLGPMLLWGGAAALAASAATLAVGLGIEQSRPVLVCLEPPCEARFIDRGWGTASAAFAGAGATWLSTWLIRDDGDDTAAWWGVAIGLAVGFGAGFATSQL